MSVTLHTSKMALTAIASPLLLTPNVLMASNVVEMVILSMWLVLLLKPVRLLAVPIVTSLLLLVPATVIAPILAARTTPSPPNLLPTELTAVSAQYPLYVVKRFFLNPISFVKMPSDFPFVTLLSRVEISLSLSSFARRFRVIFAGSD
jgi:hypothetical protein